MEAVRLRIRWFGIGNKIEKQAGKRRSLTIEEKLP
jgi:hypothetical protein